jgi:hypothetical protein
MKADGTTPVVTVDSTNSSIGIGADPSSIHKLRLYRNSSLANSYGLLIENAGTGASGIQIRNSSLESIKNWQLFISDAAQPSFKIGQDNVGDFFTINSGGDSFFSANLQVNGSSIATTAKGGTTTNYGQLDANGLRLYGSATQYNDIDFPLIVKTTGANLPTRTAIAGNVFGYIYAVNDCLDIDSTELHHGAKAGSTLSKFHVHIVTNGLDTTARYVRFTFEYLHANFGGVMAGATVGAIDLLIPANTPDRTHLIFDIGDYTNLNAGSQIVGRFCRVAATGAAPTNNPFVLKFQLHSEFDKLGTNNITSD